MAFTVSRCPCTSSAGWKLGPWTTQGPASSGSAAGAWNPASDWRRSRRSVAGQSGQGPPIEMPWSPWFRETDVGKPETGREWTIVCWWQYWHLLLKEYLYHPVIVFAIQMGKICRCYCVWRWICFLTLTCCPWLLLLLVLWLRCWCFQLHEALQQWHLLQLNRPFMWTPHKGRMFRHSKWLNDGWNTCLQKRHMINSGTWDIC